MINSGQQIQILQYLQTKKIPLNIMMELNDHLVSQINELQQERKLSFEDAFEEAKISWKTELKMLRNYNGSGTDMTVIVKEILKKKINHIFLLSAIYSLSFLAVLIFCIKYVSSENTAIFFYDVFAVMLLIPIFIFLFNIKKFSLIKKFGKTLLNVHQKGILMMFLFIPTVSIITINNFQRSANELNLFVKNGFHGYGFAVLVILFIAFGYYFFGMISMIKYLKELKKTQPFLKYFKTS